MSLYSWKPRYLALIMVMFIAGCGLLPSRIVSLPPLLYSLDDTGFVAPTIPSLSAEASTLVMSTPRAAAGFESSRIVYVRQDHTVAYFAQSQWVASPVAMLSPLLVSALARSPKFTAVVLAPTRTVGQWRLELEVIRLQHEFMMSPSRVRFTLRAYLIDNTTHKVSAWHEFESVVLSSSEDAQGGVAAANQAVRQVLEELTAFCSERVASHLHAKKV